MIISQGQLVEGHDPPVNDYFLFLVALTLHANTHWYDHRHPPLSDYIAKMKEGMRSLRFLCAQKISVGITTLEEVMCVAPPVDFGS
ncbi:MAG: hypothetical protein ACJAUP_000381 [Cellvibrionaceae bacterium]